MNDKNINNNNSKHIRSLNNVNNIISSKTSIVKAHQMFNKQISNFKSFIKKKYGKTHYSYKSIYKLLKDAMIKSAEEMRDEINIEKEKLNKTLKKMYETHSVKIHDDYSVQLKEIYYTTNIMIYNRILSLMDNGEIEVLLDNIITNIFNKKIYNKTSINYLKKKFDNSTDCYQNYYSRSDAEERILYSVYSLETDLANTFHRLAMFSSIQNSNISYDVCTDIKTKNNFPPPNMINNYHMNILNNVTKHTITNKRYIKKKDPYGIMDDVKIDTLQFDNNVHSMKTKFVTRLIQFPGFSMLNHFGFYLTEKEKKNLLKVATINFKESVMYVLNTTFLMLRKLLINENNLKNAIMDRIPGIDNLNIMVKYIKKNESEDLDHFLNKNKIAIPGLKNTNKKTNGFPLLVENHKAVILPFIIERKLVKIIKKSIREWRKDMKKHPYTNLQSSINYVNLINNLVDNSYKKYVCKYFLDKMLYRSLSKTMYINSAALLDLNEISSFIEKGLPLLPFLNTKTIKNEFHIIDKNRNILKELDIDMIYRPLLFNYGKGNHNEEIFKATLTGFYNIKDKVVKSYSNSYLMFIPTIFFTNYYNISGFNHPVEDHKRKYINDNTNFFYFITKDKYLKLNITNKDHDSFNVISQINKMILDLGFISYLMQKNNCFTRLFNLHNKKLSIHFNKEQIENFILKLKYDNTLTEKMINKYFFEFIKILQNNDEYFNSKNQNVFIKTSRKHYTIKEILDSGVFKGYRLTFYEDILLEENDVTLYDNASSIDFGEYRSFETMKYFNNNKIKLFDVNNNSSYFPYKGVGYSVYFNKIREMIEKENVINVPKKARKYTVRFFNEKSLNKNFFHNFLAFLQSNGFEEITNINLNKKKKSIIY